MWLDAPLKVEKMMRENAFEQKKKKPGLKFSPELALIGFQTTGPRFSSGKEGYTTRVSTRVYTTRVSLTVLDNPLYIYYWSS